MKDGGRACRQDERGAAAVEVVLLAPLVVMVLCLLTAGWRLWTARTEVADAASAAARAATLETSGTAAAERARQVAGGNLRLVGVACDPLSVTPDTTGFARPPGTPAEVVVTVACDVGLDDVLLPGLPGHWHVEDTGRHTMDTFRERRP